MPTPHADHRIGYGFAALLSALMSLSAGAQAAANPNAGEVPYSTPPGLTMVDVSNGAQRFGYRRIGDGEGNPLFAVNADATGKVNCAGDCAKEFSPLAAPAGAVAYDVWTLVDSEGGIKQWAYQGQPLFQYKGSRPIAEIVGAKESDKGVYWKEVDFRPEAAVAAPAGIKVRSLEVAAGYGLVDTESGAVMYHLSAAPKNPYDWRPVYAPSAALPRGDFTIVEREDNTLQWAYKGRPLYTYREDYSPGDINGMFADSSAQVALVVKHYMPSDVQITKAITHGPVMTTASGLTVYTEGQYKLQYGGRSTRDGYYLPYDNAKTVGIRGCEGECLETWHPVVAPADAQPRGFWEIAIRPEGTKQWVYKGAALYTYVDDKKLGDMKGNNRHVIVYGDAKNDSIDLTPSGGVASGGTGYDRGFGSGFYWHYVMLYTESVEKAKSKAAEYD